MLKTIVLTPSDGAALPTGRSFHGKTHHVVEMFAHLLPEGFDLDGSAKVAIACGPRGPESQYRQVLGTSHYFVEDFDFGRFFSSSGEERDKMTLRTIHDVLRDIALRHGREEAVGLLSAIARSIADSGFEMVLPVQSLTQFRNPPGWRIHVSRRLDRESGESWMAELLDRAGNRLAQKEMTRHPGDLDRRHQFHQAQFDGDVYSVMNRFGKRVFEWDLVSVLVSEGADHFAPQQFEPACKS
jgi:hypothetical protein